MLLGMASKKITVTIPEDLLEEIRADVSDRGMSAYVTEALRAKRSRDQLAELVDWLQEEYGPLTDEERQEARAELDEIDAEHDRIREELRNRSGGEVAA
jgi:Arc/MetJ-type ribon-helix-helix transcriptional regulator